MPIWLTLLISILGSAAFFSFLQFLITRWDRKKEKKEEKKDGLKKDIDDIKDALQEIKDMCDVHEKDITRAQLLILLASYPQDISEIMRLGEHYFADLEANWFMSSIFATWLKDNKIAKPTWFKSE